MKKTLLLTFFALFGLSITTYAQQCGGTFTDAGGESSPYADNSDYTVTISPSNPGELVTVTFTIFNTEPNYDALYVFNGNSINAPQIASANPGGNVPGGLAGGYWGTTIPGPFTSSAADGSLTFRFRSDTTINRIGWVANVTCAPPPTCPKPTLSSITSITSNSLTLNWTEAGAATTWECVALPVGSAVPTETTTGYSTTLTAPPYTLTGLVSSTCYSIYVRAVCSPTDKSAWSIGTNACTAVAPPICGGKFVDDGGISGPYAANSNITKTICPVNPGDLVTVTFTAFNTEANFDPLYVYDGNSAIPENLIPSTNPAGNAPGGLAGGYWGTTIPGPFTSSSADGCLTFVFRSDNTLQNPGWSADITCGPAPTCLKPTTLSVNNITHTSATLNWNSINSTNWEVLVLPLGAPAPIGPGTPVSSPTYSVNGLTPNTCYVFYVRAICSPTDASTWAGGFNFCTPLAPPVCGGQFTDNGGAAANYTNNSNNTYIICPTNVGDTVTVVFDSFDTETGWDALYVFDGNSVAAPQIRSSNPANNVPGGLAGGFWGAEIPGPFTSTSPDGCLTFNFRSDTSATRSGWLANVTCSPAPDRIILVAFVDQDNDGIRDLGESLFSTGNFVYEQNNNGTNVQGYSLNGQFTLYDTNPANTYDFSYEVASNYAPYYSVGTTNYSNISIAAGSGTQFLYFPLTLTQPYSDLTVSIAPYAFAPRPGLPYSNIITYKNLGASSANGTLTFTKPNQITSFTTTTDEIGVVNNVSGFTLPFTNLQPNETRTVIVTLTVPLGTTVNTLLTDSASITTLPNDSDTTNNMHSNTQVVVNSYDPNDKMESRGKTIPFNQFAEDDYFFYTIRFQNNGTASANDIRIEDVLNSQIDPTSVLLVSASHNCIMKRTGNQLVWEFKNIFLPTQSVNDAGSRGYIQFKVRLNPGFQAGDIIPNDASIYFDTNPAIVTNTFNTKFTVPLSVSTYNSNSLVLYPNPANNSVQIDLINTNEHLSKVVLYDILGKSVKTVSSVTADNVTVDVSDLSKGVYMVEIISETNLKVTKKLIIQ